MALSSLDTAARTLLARFRRQRPIRSGSLLITILGDAIAPRGGAITLRSLIQLAAPFGLPERLVRTSVGRLAQDGWLTSRRAGRQSEYALTPHGRQRFAEATQRIYSEPPRAWDRQWTLLILPADAGEPRERIRKEMLWLGFGLVSPGVLAHPGRTLADTQAQLAGMNGEKHAIILQAASAGLETDRQIIATGWDLAELAQSYRKFVEAFGPAGDLLARGAELSGQTAFTIRTLLIHEYRRIHLRDPLLPLELLPPEWIGAETYALCQALYRRVLSRSESYLSDHGRLLSGPLEAPCDAELRLRFAGASAGAMSA